MAVFTAQDDNALPFDEDGQSYAVFGTRVPALRSFRLSYQNPNDHEIALIQVLVGGDSEDLSPTADLQPARFPDGRLHVSIQDANASGEEFGYLVSHSILTIPGARRFQIRDVGCIGECVRPLPLPSLPGFPPPASPPLLALVGFKLFFTGARDHELDRIGVWFRGNDLHVAMRDASAGLNEPFGYLVDFVAIPTPLAGMNVSTGIERGTASGLETIPFPTPSHAHFLLRGWAFNFKKDDQEILDLGVIRSDNSFTVFYAATGVGDSFDWRVEWAHIGPLVNAPQ